MTADPTPRPPAPAHLSPESKRLWRRIVAEYLLASHHLVVLTVALEARDRMAEAQDAIRADGPYMTTKTGLRAHPGLAVERDSRVAMLRALRELGLDLTGPDAPRPPTPWRPS